MKAKLVVLVTLFMVAVSTLAFVPPADAASRHRHHRHHYSHQHQQHHHYHHNHR